MDTKTDSINLRTKEEMEKARHELCDVFYPRRIDTWSGCDFCGDREYHKTECDKGRSYGFKGWQSMVCSTKSVSGPCMKDDCKNDATVRVRLNIWGSLCELDLCDEHGKKKDGSLRDKMRVECI